MRRRGTTLVEVLVATVLMAMFTTMVATAMVMAYRYYHGSEDRLVRYHDAYAALDRMGRRLSLCSQVLSPKAWTAAPTTTGTPEPPQAPVHPLAQDPATWLSFRYQSWAQGTLLTVDYYLDGNLLVERTQGTGLPETQVLADHITDFQATPSTQHAYTVVEVDLTADIGAPSPQMLSNQLKLTALGTPVP